MYKRKNKSAQAWGMDLIIGFTIFSLGITSFYLYSLNTPSEAKEAIESLSYDGKIISDNILSNGYPDDWNDTNVISIGILSDNKINNTKLREFYDLADSEYDRTKRLFNTVYDYWFFLNENMTTINADVDGIGLKPSNPKNLIKITRFTVYEDKPMSAYLYVFEN